MPPITEMEGTAIAVGAIIGIVAVLSPVIARLGKLEILQFGHPKVFLAFGELGALAAFLSVFTFRSSLPSLPAAWIWIVVSLVMGGVAFWLALRHEAKGADPAPGTVVSGLVLYILAIAFLIFGLSKAAATAEIFYTLEGRVTSPGRSVEGTEVELGGENREFRRTVGEDGAFRYLLYKPEAEDVYQIRADTGEWQFVVWEPSKQRTHFIRLPLEDGLAAEEAER